MGTEKPEIAGYIKNGDANLEFLVCTEVLKLESLHLGYWEEGSEASWSGLGRAQDRFTRELIGHVPPGVERVLDVGSGLGDVARAFRAAGHRVTAISPDPNQARYLRGPRCDGIEFHASSFEDLDLDRRFDLVLMSESQNYFDADDGFRKCRRHLVPGGHVLVSGMFRRRPERDGPFGFMRHCEEGYLSTADDHGFRLAKSVDITARTVPTLAVARDAYQEYVVPALSVVSEYLDSTGPVTRTLLRWILRRKIRDLEVVRRYYEAFFDPELFVARVRYLTLLFEMEEA